MNLYIIQKELENTFHFEAYMTDPALKSTCAYPLLEPDTDVFSEGPVYILPASNLPENAEFKGRPSFVCAGKPPAAYLRRKCNLLYTESPSADAKTLCNHIQAIFYKYYQWEQALQTVIDENRPLKEMGKLTFPLLKNPMILQASGFKVLFQILPTPDQGASSLHKSYYREYQIHDNSYIMAEEVNRLVLDSEYKESIQNNGPVLYSGKNYGFRSITYNLNIDQIPVARLCVDEILKPFTDYDYIIIKILGDYLKKGLQRHHYNPFGRPQELDVVLTSLLSHHLITEEKIQHVVTAMDWNINDTFFCMIMESQISHTEDILSSLAFQMMLSLPTDCYVIFRGRLVMLFNLSKIRLTRDEVIQKCVPHLRDNILKTGISTTFDDFKDLYYYYLQADAALLHGKQQAPSFWYFRFEDYNLAYLIQKCCEKQISTALIHEGLKKLMAHDVKKKTNYVHILRLYLNYNMNIADTARAAFLHRNTLIYQINNILKISGLNLDDPDTRLHLLISYKILDIGPIRRET